MIKKSDLKLVPVKDPILNNPPEEFNFQGDIDSRMLSNLLIDRMKEIGGIGLSANQVGLNIKMFVMGVDDSILSVINPVIDHYGEEEVVMEEGCLSFPGMMVKIKRPETISVSFFSPDGVKHNLTLTGLSSRVFQHEYDHMLGKTMQYRVSKLKWELALKRQKHLKDKLVKKHVQQKLLEIKKHVDNSSRIS